MQNLPGAWLVAALLLSAGSAATRPRLGHLHDWLVLANDDIAVEFQGKQPRLRVRDAREEGRGYEVHLTRIVELATGEAPEGRGVASFELTSEPWDVAHTEEPDGITLRLHREGVLRTPAGPAGTASVTLVFRIADRITHQVVGDAMVPVTTHEVKFDLLVHRWDWASKANRIALEFLLAGEDGPRHSTGVQAVQGGLEVGYVRWLPAAEAQYAGSASRMAPVEHRVGPRENGALAHWLVYGAPGFDSLAHDPTLGIVPARVSSAAEQAPALTQADLAPLTAALGTPPASRARAGART